MLERVRSLNSRVKWSIIAGLCLAGIILALLMHPIPQPLVYHHFADQRTIAGIPRAWDVLSNLAFLLSGAWDCFT
jgi:hypothetical protein